MLPRPTIRYFIFSRKNYLLLSRLDCLCGLTGRLDAADNGVLRGDNRNLVELEVGSDDPFTDLERSDVDVELVGKVLHEGANAEVAYELLEFTTGLYTCCVTSNIEGNLDSDRLVLGNLEEIYVEAVFLNGMELKLVDNGCILLVIEVEVYDEGCRIVGKSLEFLCVNCENYVLHSLSIQVARYESLLADGLDNGLVADLTDLAIELKMFHCYIS